MTRQHQFMNQAIASARRGMAAGQLPYGAAIVRGGRVIASGHNKVVADNDPTAHAEIVCIRGACRKLRRRDLSDCEIYCTCEPCAMCAGACYAAGFGVIHFGAFIADKGTYGLRDLGVGAEALSQLSPHAPRAIGGVGRAQCLQLFQIYTGITDGVAPKPGRKR